MPQLVMRRCCSPLSAPSPPTVQLPDKVQPLFSAQMLLSCTFSRSVTTRAGCWDRIGYVLCRYLKVQLKEQREETFMELRQISMCAYIFLKGF